jgi:hypothetical protein
MAVPATAAFAAALAAVAAGAGCAADPPSLTRGTGGSTSTDGGGAGGGAGGFFGGTGFGNPTQTGGGVTIEDQYGRVLVTRNGVSYTFIANGWGPNWESHAIAVRGTSFNVVSTEGTQGPNYEPASYPAVFCGRYANITSGACGLPRAIAETASLRTGWIWHANGNGGEYNAAWDIWLANGTAFSSYLMVWLRDPPGQQPAGTVRAFNVTVANVPLTWNVWQGTVNGAPYIAYALAEGQDASQLEFDVLDFVRDVPGRGLTLPGSHVLAVAIGFEIWNGPITNLMTEDFYVDVK